MITEKKLLEAGYLTNTSIFNKDFVEYYKVVGEAPASIGPDEVVILRSIYTKYAGTWEHRLYCYCGRSWSDSAEGQARGGCYKLLPRDTYVSLFGNPENEWCVR